MVEKPSSLYATISRNEVVKYKTLVKFNYLYNLFDFCFFLFSFFLFFFFKCQKKQAPRIQFVESCHGYKPSPCCQQFSLILFSQTPHVTLVRLGWICQNHKVPQTFSRQLLSLLRYTSSRNPSRRESWGSKSTCNIPSI